MRLLILSLLFLSVVCGCATKSLSSPATDYEIIIWDKGKKTDVNSAAKIEHVQDAIIQIVEHSDDLFKLIVTEDYIKDLKKQRTCLEIVLSSPQSASIGGENISFSRLLIPINRENNTETIVIYLGNNKSYYTPPYISTHGKADLRNLVELLDIVSLLN